MLLRLDAILQQAFPTNSRNYVSLIAESFYARLIMDRRCSFLDCAKASVVTLGDCEYCVVHFISTSYRHLEEFRRGDQEKEGGTEVQRGSLLEIVDQATSVSLTTNDLTNQERGQLLDILFWASGLLSDGRT